MSSRRELSLCRVWGPPQRQNAIWWGPLEPLGDVHQRGGKRVTAFAVEGDVDLNAVKSNTFELEWPPKTGSMRSFPEIDRAAGFDLPAAHVKILESQRSFLGRLVDLVDRGAKPTP
jgi:predicted NUDIX family NTP pyrophosphohydrolase